LGDLNGLAAIGPNYHNSPLGPTVFCRDFTVPPEATGGTLAITFDNNPPGNLRIVKTTVGGDGTFDFLATGPNGFNQTPSILTIGGVGQTTPTFEVPGNSSPYNVSETGIPGDPVDDFVLTSATCVVNGSDPFAPTNFTVPSGKTVVCTFVNKKKGHIIIDKVTDPPTTDPFFHFAATGSQYVDFDLAHPTTPNDQYLAPGNYSVRELVPNNWLLKNILCQITDNAPTGDSSVNIVGNPGGPNSTFEPGDDRVSITLGPGDSISCTFTNELGGRRMTGGGSIFPGNDRSGLRITHGFELHCNHLDLPNRLEINWAGTATRQSQFHLETLTSAVCTDDPNIDQKPPKKSNFDTFTGTGVGRYNGVSGYTINFIFVDAGEPGGNVGNTPHDTAFYWILDSGGNTVLGPVFGELQQGNHQAH
jgi:hypothetical protein